jgi:LCP family protein required for cell wall assembly
MSRTSPAGHRSAPRGRRIRSHKAERQRTLGQTVGLTLLSALIPGLGLLMGGRRRLGAAVMSVTFGLLGLAVVIVATRRDEVFQLVVDPTQLLVAAGVLIVLGLCWVAIVISSHRLIRPGSVSTAGRALGAAFVGLLCFAIAAPMAVATQNVIAQRGLVRSVFASEGNSKSATRQKVDKDDPWAKTPRLNVLLLGADDGQGRQGIRTDTVILASINTKTGATALMTFPRNTVKMPFPEDSPLHEAYPDGFWKAGTDPMSGDAATYYLDAMYRNVQEAHDGILGPSDNQGADILKTSVGEATGLKVHYYVQINLRGFEKMVDALGGITVNVNYPVPVGGDDHGTIGDKSDDTLPIRYITPGRDRHLMGTDALWFARGRYGVPTADHARQVRQRCTINAIVGAADPATVLTSYQQIASAGKNILRTDIPQELLPALLELGLKVKGAKVTNINLTQHLKYGHPDFDGVRETIAKTFAKKPTAKPTSSSSSSTHATPPRKSSVTTSSEVKDECRYEPTGE